MQAILLDEQQSSVCRNDETIQVRDPRGLLLGHIVPGGRVPLDSNRWVDSWQQWYLEIEDLETDELESN